MLWRPYRGWSPNSGDAGAISEVPHAMFAGLRARRMLLCTAVLLASVSGFAVSLQSAAASDIVVTVSKRARPDRATKEQNSPSARCVSILRNSPSWAVTCGETTAIALSSFDATKGPTT